MVRWMWVVVFVFCWSFSVSAQSGTTLTAKEKQEAQTMFEEAEAYYAIQEYASALSLYKEIYLKTKASVLLFNIGQCYRNMNQFVEAKKSYESFLEVEPQTAYRVEIEKLLQDMEQKSKEQTPAPIKTVPATRRMLPISLLGAAGVVGLTGLLTGLKASKVTLEANQLAFVIEQESTPERVALLAELNAKADRLELATTLSVLSAFGLTFGGVLTLKQQRSTVVVSVTPSHAMLWFGVW